MNYIYGLHCPIAGCIRYVGKAKDPHARLRAHISDSKRKKYKHHASNWIFWLLQKGIAPELRILAALPDAMCWQNVERNFIAAGSLMGWQLTNSTSGGDGAPDLDAFALRQKSAKAAQLWRRPSYREKMGHLSSAKFKKEQGDRLRSRWDDPAHREKMKASRWNEDARKEEARRLLLRQSKIKAAITPEVIARRNASIKAAWARRKAATA